MNIINIFGLIDLQFVNLMLILVVICYLIYFKLFKKAEGFADSIASVDVEALKNIASLYNGDTLIVNKLKVLQDANIGTTLNANNAVIKTSIKANDGTIDNNLSVMNYLGVGKDFVVGGKTSLNLVDITNDCNIGRTLNVTGDGLFNKNLSAKGNVKGQKILAIDRFELTDANGANKGWFKPHHAYAIVIVNDGQIL